jgi:hypothetical protein
VSDLRPFHFNVVFWGDRFREYLTEFCLPSLLSPNNIPALSGGRRNRFIFCTTPEDQAALRRTPIFALLDRHIEPHFIEIPPAPAGLSGCEHMGVGHKLAAEMTHREHGYGVFVTPDLMMSDGSVAALERYARAGHQVVLTVALRFGEEPLFEQLAALGAIREGRDLSPAGRPLAITGRQLVAAGIRSFHSETQRYEWESPSFTNFPCACWWRVPGEDGIVVHSLSWCPVLVDYAAVGRHDTSTLDTWTLDADYVYRNFGNSAGVHVVTDSDEIMLVSWAPLSDRPQSLSRNFLTTLPGIGGWLKGAILRGAVTSGTFDPLKQRIFFLPVRWHSRDVTPAWAEIERGAARTLRRYLGDLTPGEANRGVPAPEARGAFGRAALGALGRIWIVAADVAAHADRLTLRLAQVLRGDRAAAGRLWRRLRTIVKTIRGAEIKGA